MKVSIVGAGAVGTQVLVEVFNSEFASSIVLIDQNREKAEGEIFDLAHTTAFTHTSNTALVAGELADAVDSDVIVVTAGAQVKATESRDELAEKNAGLIADLANRYYQVAPNAIVILVTNPVDLVAYYAIKNSPFPKERVISTGTLLDTARFMRILAEYVNIDPKNIFGYVLGEHGATASIPWSLVNICGFDLDQYCRKFGLPIVDKNATRNLVIEAGFEIFKRKGNTNHGIAATVFRIIRAIQLNEKSVLPVGCLLEGEYGFDDVVLGVPAIIGRQGIEQIIEHSLTAEETANLKVSADHFELLRNRVESAAGRDS